MYQHNGSSSRVHSKRTIYAKAFVNGGSQLYLYSKIDVLEKLEIKSWPFFTLEIWALLQLSEN